MIRRTLEGVAQEQGAAERTVEASMRKLRSLGRIDSTLSTWSESLSVVTSSSANLVDVTVTRQNAEDALAFAEALLDHIYVLRKKFDSYQARRSVHATA
jgi:hypothetical protein